MEELDKDVMEFFSTLFKPYGLNDLTAKVIGALYIEPEEVPMEYIAKKTGYSLASICNTMKMLETLGMAQRIKKPGTNKVFFYMEKELAKLNLMKLHATHNNFIKPAKETLPLMMDKYRDKARDEKSKQKLRIMENYYEQLLQFEGILDEFMKKLEGISKSKA